MDYELMAQCIKSGQVPDSDIQELMQDDHEFKEWYLANRLTYSLPAFADSAVNPPC